MSCPWSPESAHHLRTFSMVAITFLMSSLARLRVSARTVRPAMLAGWGRGRARSWTASRPAGSGLAPDPGASHWACRPSRS